MTRPPNQSPPPDASGRRALFPLLALAGGLLAGFGLLPPAAAEEPGGFAPYQKAFAKSLQELGDPKAPSGPIWLQPEVLPAREACRSCHLGITDNRFLYARLPYRRHSGHYLKDHALKRFGCTVCHGGIAQGLTFAAAGHAPPADEARRRQWQQHYGWSAPGARGMVPLAAITGRCGLCHRGKQLPAGAEPYAAARTFVAEKRCSACHIFRDRPRKPVWRAVRIERLGSKVGGAWLRSFLKDPSGFRPHTAMPRFGLAEAEIRSLTAYFNSLQDSAIRWGKPASTDAGAVGRGRKLVERRRCQTCHDVPGLDETGFLKQTKVGPALAGVGAKLNPDWIRHWLEDPQAVRPDTGMPRFRFKPDEIEDITAFLASLRSGGALAPAAGSASGGEGAAAVAARYGCAACHIFKDLERRVVRSDLTGVGPEFFARLATSAAGPRSAEGPQGVFHTSPTAPRLLDPKQTADAVLTFLAGETDLPLAEGFIQPAPGAPPPFEVNDQAGGLVRELRCLSCHTIRGSGGDIGPELTYAGSKLRREWLVAFLQSPTPIRPMNRARMPIFGLSAEEAGRLADWILSELKAPEVEKSKPDLESAFSFVGASKIKSPYGCVTCHRFGEEGGKVGPALTHVGTRLQTKWIYHWIKNPKRWIPGVRMPNFEMNQEDLAALTLFLEEQK